jgi:hypothetical protein
MTPRGPDWASTAARETCSGCRSSYRVVSHGAPSQLATASGGVESGANSSVDAGLVRPAPLVTVNPGSSNAVEPAFETL